MKFNPDNQEVNNPVSLVAKQVMVPYGQQQPVANQPHYDANLLAFMGVLDASQQKALKLCMKYKVVPIQVFLSSTVQNVQVIVTVMLYSKK